MATMLSSPITLLLTGCLLVGACSGGDGGGAGPDGGAAPDGGGAPDGGAPADSFVAPGDLPPAACIGETDVFAGNILIIATVPGRGTGGMSSSVVRCEETADRFIMVANG